MVQNIFNMGLQILYYSMSSGVGKGASERVSAVKPANEASSAEQANEGEPSSEQQGFSFSIISCRYVALCNLKSCFQVP